MSTLPTVLSLADAKKFIDMETAYINLSRVIDDVRASKKPRRYDRVKFVQERSARLVKLQAELSALPRPTPVELQTAYQTIWNDCRQKEEAFRVKMDVMNSKYPIRPNGWVLIFKYDYGQNCFFFDTRKEAEDALAFAYPHDGNIMTMEQYLIEKDNDYH